MNGGWGMVRLLVGHVPPIELNDDLAGTMVVDFFEFANVA